MSALGLEPELAEALVELGITRVASTSLDVAEAKVAWTLPAALMPTKPTTLSSPTSTAPTGAEAPAPTVLVSSQGGTQMAPQPWLRSSHGCTAFYEMDAICSRQASWGSARSLQCAAKHCPSCLLMSIVNCTVFLLTCMLNEGLQGLPLDLKYS